MPDDARRLAKLAAFREAYRRAYHARREARQAHDRLSMAEESLGDFECALALDCNEHGPLVDGGRRYECVWRDGLPWVVVTPLDEALMASMQNCPGGVDDVP